MFNVDLTIEEILQLVNTLVYDGRLQQLGNHKTIPAAERKFRCIPAPSSHHAQYIHFITQKQCVRRHRPFCERLARPSSQGEGRGGDHHVARAFLDNPAVQVPRHASEHASATPGVPLH